MQNETLASATAAPVCVVRAEENDYAVLQSLQGHLGEVKGLLGEPQEVNVASLEGLGSLSDWWQVFRVTQVCCWTVQLWQTHKGAC